MENKDKNIKAIIYDFGGVVMKYTDESIADSVRTPHAIFENHLEVLEKGQLSLYEFSEIASEDNKFKKYTEKIGKSENVGEALSSIMIKDQIIEKSIKVLKENGFKIALLTNNFFVDKNKSKSTIPDDLSEFDVIVESCKVGMRKPEQNIYEYTLSLLNLKSNEAIFLDDMEENCKGAENIGLKAIQVKPNKSEDAVKEIERLIGLSIL